MDKKLVSLLVLLIFLASCTQSPESKDDVAIGSLPDDNDKVEDTIADSELDEEIMDDVDEPVEDADSIDENEQTAGPIKVTAEKMDNKVKISWTKYDVPDFKFYKVVRSNVDATPTYSEEGFIETISNQNITTFTDINPLGGVSYYSVTAVLNLNKYVDGSFAKIEFPDPAETPDQEIKLTATKTEKGVLLEWTKYSGNFLQYKIVRSTKNPLPKYPDDRLIKTIAYVNETTYTDTLAEKGTNYYAVTVVRPNKSKFTSARASIVVS